ncbi:MAG: hypothetical protein FJ090_22210, partial [Deltaproteobacteria bacterium]|nr:hypothetical protein [Deltaproteobacteria bacterium]
MDQCETAAATRSTTPLACSRRTDDALHFFPHAPSTGDIEGLVVEIGLACERWLARQGFAGEAEDSAEGEDDAQGVLQLASLGGAVATGERAGKR